MNAITTPERRARGGAGLVAVAIVVGGAALAIDGCRSRPSGALTGDSATAEPSGDAEAAPTAASASTSALTAPTPSGASAKDDAACSVSSASYPAGPGPAVGDDVSGVLVPLVVPEGASLSIAVRRSGHELRIKGPAAIRPCTRDEPDVILVASGEVSTDARAPVRPGSELLVATPAFVAVFGRAALRLRVTHAQSTWDVEDGEVTITNLDAPKTVVGRNKDFLKRYEDGGVLVTRCSVQAAAAASAERMLAALTSRNDAGPGSGSGASASPSLALPPLPSSSIGILSAQHVKHARERVLDCAFAAAFAMSCDQWAVENGAAVTGCGPFGYVKLREYVARAIASGPIPPGSPLPADAAP